MRSTHRLLWIKELSNKMRRRKSKVIVEPYLLAVLIPI